MSNPTATPKPHIRQIVLRSGLIVDLCPGETLLVIGPNSGGKSTFLRDISESISTKAEPLWVQSVDWFLEPGEAARTRFKETYFVHEKNSTNLRNPFGTATHFVYVDQFLKTGKTSEKVDNFLVRTLGASERIQLADTVPALDRNSKVATHPYHSFYSDKARELALSEKVKAAFGQDLRINRSGSTIGAHLGKAPTQRDFVDYEDAVLNEMVKLEDAGDGIRSYVGILLNITVPNVPVVSIDEPEAFLHPPQARRLGRELASNLGKQTQAIVATHNIDILKGAISGQSESVKILYLNRHAPPTSQAILIHPSDVKRFSEDPFLQTTDAINSVFFKKTIICESHSDIIFYKWAFKKINKRLDVDEWSWIPSNGKHLIPTIAQSLKPLGVSPICIFDVDVLLSNEVLAACCEALNFDLGRYGSLLKRLHDSIAVPPAGQILEEIASTVEKVDESSGDFEVDDAVRSVKRTVEKLGKSWALKRGGFQILPSGPLQVDIKKLVGDLRSVGIYILTIGEMENFDKTVGRHGQRWVERVMQKRQLPAATKQLVKDEFRGLV